MLRNHYLSGLDVNKLCIYHGATSAPFQILWNTPTKGRFEKSVTFYPDSGSTTYNHLTHRKFKFYDKTAQSDDLKFAPEKLIAFIRQASFTLLNMEYSMQGKD